MTVTHPTPSGVAKAVSPTASRNSPPLTLEDFIKQQERKSKIGDDGELIALQEERQCIEKCGCSNPEDYVRRISVDDVGRGYDIESTWPNEERCIEVKSSTQGSDGFYISKNERRVLSELGPRAWIYFVEVDQNGQGHVVRMLPDPMKTLLESAFQPVMWRVQLPNV